MSVIFAIAFHSSMSDFGSQLGAGHGRALPISC
jgi:hypothetical protein